MNNFDYIASYIQFLSLELLVREGCSVPWTTSVHQLILCVQYSARLEDIFPDKLTPLKFHHTFLHQFFSKFNKKQKPSVKRSPICRNLAARSEEEAE